MDWHHWLSIGSALWALAGMAWWLIVLILVDRALTEHRSSLNNDSLNPERRPLPVTVFKSLPPLSGGSPTPWVEQSLLSLAGQLDAEDNLIIGFRSEDTAGWRPLLDRLESRAVIQRVSLDLGGDVFHNRKVVALYQMAQAADSKQSLWFWSDADIHMPTGMWSAIKAEWNNAEAKAITYPYRLLHVPSTWGGLEALYVNAEFLPGVQASARLATERKVGFSLGAGILFCGPQVMTPEAWDELSRDLADDFYLGQMIGTVTLSRLILETEASECRCIDALNHYFRWHKTVRWSQPAGYFGQILLIPLLGISIGTVLNGGLLPLLGFIWLMDMGAGYLLLRRIGAWRWALTGWLVIWPLLRAWVWLMVRLPGPVAWRNNFWWHRRRKNANPQIMDKAIPHPPLKPHYNSLNEKQAFLRKVFDAAAPFYEGIASWGFFGSGDWYRRDALRRSGLKRGMKAIDVASGTGPTARAVADVVGSPQLVTAVEPSEGMMKESMKRLNCVHHQAPAEALPVGDSEFDYLTMGFALRHVDNLEKAFREYFRVLKPGSTACVLDLTMPKNPVGRFFLKLYFKYTLPFLTRVITGNRDAEYLMAYYWDTLEYMVPREEVVRHFESAGFIDVKHHVVIGMFSEYTARKPV